MRISSFLFGSVLLSAFVFSGVKAWATPASASGELTASQRAEIVKIVRQSLKDDPGILSDALQSLRERVMQQQHEKVRASVKQHWSALVDSPSYAVRGNPHGKFTVVEFLDPRCSYCRGMMPNVERFLARHKDVRLVERVVPVLGKGSLLDAQAIQAASAQGKYDVLRQALMTDTVSPTPERIRQVAKANGMDADRLIKGMASQGVVDAIRTNLDLAQAVGLDGTPTFVFGAAIVAPGALSDDQMDADLEQEKRA